MGLMYCVQQYAEYAGRMTTGRPRATSRDTIADAACELFLERGYATTTVADITSRAGVSRSSFFNYFASKGAILWAGLDERLDAAVAALAEGAAPRSALLSIVDGFVPDSLALAIANAETMSAGDELERERALRQARLARAVAARFATGTGSAPSNDDPLAPARLHGEVVGAAAAGAVLAAVWAWALAGPGRTSLRAVAESALDAVPELGSGSARRTAVSAPRHPSA